MTSNPASASSGTALPSLGSAELFSAKGLVALITGGGTGIGLVMARALAEAGAERVYIVGRRLDVLQAAADSIESNGQAEKAKKVIVPLACDVTSKASLAEAAAHVQADIGYLNVVLVNAGIQGPQTKTPDETDTSFTLEAFVAQQLAVDVEAYDQTFLVNATAVWFTTMTFLPLLDAGNKRQNVPQQPSQVIVTTSIAGFNKVAPGGWSYGQSKAAAHLATKQLSVLLPRWGVRVNTIAPGYFPSQMTQGLANDAGGFSTSEPTLLDKSVVPLGRMGFDTDMAGTVLYMVSRAGAYLNGSVIVVDGGRLTKFPSIV